MAMYPPPQSGETSLDGCLYTTVCHVFTGSGLLSQHASMKNHNKQSGETSLYRCLCTRVCHVFTGSGLLSQHASMKNHNKA